MENCAIYVDALRWLFYILYVVGIGMLIGGWIKFKFNPLWLLMILTPALPLFPTFFGLRRQYLRKTKATQASVDVASRQFRASLWFVVVAIVVWFVIPVVYLYKAMNVSPITIDVEQWSRSLFIGSAVVIVCYVFSLIIISKMRQKR